MAEGREEAREGVRGLSIFELVSARCAKTILSLQSYSLLTALTLFTPFSLLSLQHIHIRYIVYILLRKHTLRSCRIERVEIDDLAHGLVTQDRGEFSSRCSPRRQNKFACFGFLHSGRRDTLSSVSADQAGKGEN